MLRQKLQLKVQFFICVFTFLYLVVLDSNIIRYGPSNESALIGSNIEMPCKLSEEYIGRNDVSVVWHHNVNILLFITFYQKIF